MSKIDEIMLRHRGKRLAIFLIIIAIISISLLLVGRDASKFNQSCARCYFCINRCPFHAISFDKHGYPVINRSKCIAWDEKKKRFEWQRCGMCLRGCPTRALDLLNEKKEVEKHTIK